MRKTAPRGLQRTRSPGLKLLARPCCDFRASTANSDRFFGSAYKRQTNLQRYETVLWAPAVQLMQMSRARALV